jgi:hypothetical protein
MMRESRTSVMDLRKYRATNIHLCKSGIASNIRSRSRGGTVVLVLAIKDLSGSKCPADDKRAPPFVIRRGLADRGCAGERD